MAISVDPLFFDDVDDILRWGRSRTRIAQFWGQSMEGIWLIVVVLLEYHSNKRRGFYLFIWLISVVFFYEFSFFFCTLPGNIWVLLPYSVSVT